MDGEGTYTFEDGSSCKGNWQKNNMEGRGVCRYADGRVEDGQFKHDEFVPEKSSGFANLMEKGLNGLERGIKFLADNEEDIKKVYKMLSKKKDDDL